MRAGGKLTVRRLALVLLTTAVLLGGCGVSSSHNAAAPAKARFRVTFSREAQAVRHQACISADCGPWSVTLSWQIPPFPGTTGYYLFINETQVGSASSSPYKFSGSDCKVTNTLGVQAHDSSGHTGPLWTTRYTSPACPRAQSGRRSASRRWARHPRYSPLHVSGNQLLNAQNQSVFIHGVDRAGTEYSCSQGNGFFDGLGTDLAAEETQIRGMASWGINSQNIGLNEDCWLGINGVSGSLSGRNYQDAIKALVQTDEAHHIYPVITLWWMGPGTVLPTGNPTGQDPMPDNDHAPLFWEEVANTFKNDHHVIFRLKEEPSPGGSGVDKWQCWSRGDVSYQPNGDNTPPIPPTPSGKPNLCAGLVIDPTTKRSYQAVGMQSLINIIRGTGATNIIQVPGVDFANNLSCTETDSPVTCGFLDSTDGIKLSDTLTPAQLMADVDVYPDSNLCGQQGDTSCYDNTYKPVARVMPLEAGEIGQQSGTLEVDGLRLTDVFMHWMDQNGAGYYAFGWDTWAGLISSYTSATPASPWGTNYHTWIQAAGPPFHTPPSISGKAQVGQTVRLTGGPTNAAVMTGPGGIQWQSCTSRTGGCSNIARATDVTYSPGQLDVGKYLKVSVEYGNDNGLSTGVSAEFGPVAPVTQPTDGITFTQATTAACNISVPTGKLNLSSAVNAGDDLFAVFSGMGYTLSADDVTGVSDNVNGAWTRVAQAGSQANGQNDLSYSVFELLNSKAAPSGLTLTTTGVAGKMKGTPSGLVFATRGVASVTAGTFHSTLQAGASPFTAPTLASVPANDVVVGLWGVYSGNGSERFSAPPGWHTASIYQVYGVNCAANAMDWTQPSSTGSVTPSINAFPSYYMGGGLDLHP